MSSGEVIYFDKQRGTGFISGNDGNRYVFAISDINGGSPLAKGAKVDFESEGDRAREITAHARLQTSPQSAAGSVSIESKPETIEPVVTPGVFRYFRYCITTGFVRFRGRARRREYWAFVLISLIGFAIAGGGGFALGTALGFDESREPTVSAIAIGVFWLFLVLPSLAVLIRRLHDIGLSGWFILLGLVPMVGSLIILVFTLIASQKHENKWGDIPAGVRPGL